MCEEEEDVAWMDWKPDILYTMFGQSNVRKSAFITHACMFELVGRYAWYGHGLGVEVGGGRRCTPLVTIG